MEQEEVYITGLDFNVNCYIFCLRTSSCKDTASLNMWDLKSKHRAQHDLERCTEAIFVIQLSILIEYYMIMFS